MPIGFLQATQANYVDALTIGPSQQLTSVAFVVSAPNSVLAQVAKLDKSGEPYWDQNEFVIQPGSGAYENIAGIRFRTYQNQSNVLCQGYFADDPTPLGFTPGSSSFSGGTVSPVTALNAITGQVGSTGTIVAGSGYSVVKGAGGVYTINFNTAFAQTPIIMLNPQSFLIAHLGTASASSFQALFTSTGGVGTDTAFHFLALATQ